MKRLNNELCKPKLVPMGRHRVFSFNGLNANIRVATQKSGSKYWFDVSPALYEGRRVECFIYACGSAAVLYVFPVEDFKRMIAGAHIGGVNQYPNFTIYVDTNNFEPAGHSDCRYPIGKYLNNFAPFGQFRYANLASISSENQITIQAPW